MNDKIETAGTDAAETFTAAQAKVVLDETLDSEGAVIAIAEAVPSSEGTASVDDIPSVDTSQRPQVTFMGNTYDMTSLFAFASGILVLASCLTCGQIIYCLPVVPFILGIGGLLMAKQSVDAERTRRWSWLGIGSGSVVLVLLAIALVAYAIFIAFVVWMNLAVNPNSYAY